VAEYRCAGRYDGALLGYRAQRPLLASTATGAPTFSTRLMTLFFTGHPSIGRTKLFMLRSSMDVELSGVFVLRPTRVRLLDGLGGWCKSVSVGATCGHR
jgi:hypothetical protein